MGENLKIRGHGKNRGCLGIPGISLMTPLLNQGGKARGEARCGRDIEPMMTGREGSEIFRGKLEETTCRAQPPTMLRMRGMVVLELHVDEGTGQLDQPLMEAVIGSTSSILEPKMLEDIMRLVIELSVEALEVSEIAAVEFRGSTRGLQSLHELPDAFRFFHRRFSRGGSSSCRSRRALSRQSRASCKDANC